MDGSIDERRNKKYSESAKDYYGNKCGPHTYKNRNKIRRDQEEIEERSARYLRGPDDDSPDVTDLYSY